ncbi:hypothetical protein ACLOJK_016429 [Asimina triloba]
MVCQAASQTRFRALKHENGIAGNSTIIVRVIACFQPLQDCQAEYFRHLLKPVTSSGMQQLSFSLSLTFSCALHSIDDDVLGDLISGQFSAYTEPHSFSDPPHGTVPGFAVDEFPELKLAGESLYYGYCQLAITPMMIESSVPGERFSGHPSELCGADRKPRDKKMKHASSIFSSLGLPVQDPCYADLNLSRAEPLPCREPCIPNSIDIANWLELDENHAIGIPRGDRSDMHEDTEELDALLCSDDEDDEEMSTGHSPSEVAGCSSEGEYDSKAQAASSTPPTKRKRIDDEIDPLLMDTATSGKTRGRGDGAEFSNVKGSIPSSISKRLRAKKIRETVSLLRSIIPGGKGKDAATVLDEAIQYLKSLGLKAKAVGVATV